VAGEGTSRLVVAGEESCLPLEVVEETRCPCVEEPCRRIPSLEQNSVEGQEMEEVRRKTCSTTDLAGGREPERKVQGEEGRGPVELPKVQLFSTQY
jgi:hypothetical protein